MATKPTPSRSAAPVKPAPKPVAPPPPPEKEAGVRTVSARLSKEKDPDQRTVSIDYNFGSNIDEAVEIFGADVVYQKAIDALVIDCQANIRRRIAKGETDEQIETALASWKPTLGSSGPRKSHAEKVSDMLGKLSAEERAAVLAQLKAGA